MKYWLLFALLIVATVSANELGYGVIALVVLMPLSLWVMKKAYDTSTPS